jgi:hypothetical protein
MGPIPEDLIVFLIFGAFVLLQILRNRRRNKARHASAEPAQATPADTETQAVAAVEPVAETPMPQPWTTALAEGPRPKPSRRARPAAELPATRRFSRRKLIGDRRSLQDAVVMATILGPCLALRPRDDGSPR